MYDYLEKSDDLALTDISYTLNEGRPDFAERVAVVADSVEQLRIQLDQIRKGVQNTPGVFYGRSDKEKQQTRSTVFLLADLAEDAPIDLSELWQEPLFQQHYQTGLDLCEGSIIPSVQHVLFLYAQAKCLSSIGVVPKAVLGIGLGKGVADILLNKQSLHDVIQGARNARPNGQPVPDEKLNAILQKMIADGHNQFVSLETTSMLGSQVSRLLSTQSHVLTCTFPHKRAVQAASIAALYCDGAELRWEHLYQNQQRRRVHLPTYAFTRQRYFLPLQMQSLGKKLNDLPFSPQETSDQERRVATFAELLQLVQESIADELDLSVSYEDNGGDSLTAMQIAALIQQRYGHEVTIDLLEEEMSLQELIERILSDMHAYGLTTA